MRIRFLALTVLSLLLASCGVLPQARPNTTQDPPAIEAPTATSAQAPSPTAAPAVPVVLIMDASGSMQEADVAGGTTRMAAAQEAAKKFVAGVPAGTPVALVSYGDRTPEDAPKQQGCTDVSVKVPLGPPSETFGPAVDGLRPTGWTPITAALTQAVQLVPEGPAHIVLISDGEETCAPPEPCEVAGKATAQRPGLVVSVIGLRASSAQLACIARAGKGVYVTADNADQLNRRLEAVRDPGKAAIQLSPQGASGIAPGRPLKEIRALHPDFPAVQPVPGQIVEVVWRDCRWGFDDQQILQAITVDGALTIDGIRVGDPAAAANVLGRPVKTEPAPQGEWRYYVADRATKRAWRLQVANDRIIRIVLCACLPEEPVTLDNAVLDTTGFGPIKVGMRASELQPRGWARMGTCGWEATPALTDRGVSFAPSGDTVVEVSLTGPGPQTRSGARVGMTYAQVRAIYGNKLEKEMKDGNGGPFEIAIVRADNREIVFTKAWDRQPYTDSTRIETIAARPYSKDMYGGC